MLGWKRWSTIGQHPKGIRLSDDSTVKVARFYLLSSPPYLPTSTFIPHTCFLPTQTEPLAMLLVSRTVARLLPNKRFILIPGQKNEKTYGNTYHWEAFCSHYIAWYVKEVSGYYWDKEICLVKVWFWLMMDFPHFDVLYVTTRKAWG